MGLRTKYCFLLTLGFGYVLSHFFSSNDSYDVGDTVATVMLGITVGILFRLAHCTQRSSPTQVFATSLQILAVSGVGWFLGKRLTAFTNDAYFPTKHLLLYPTVMLGALFPAFCFRFICPTEGASRWRFSIASWIKAVCIVAITGICLKSWCVLTMPEGRDGWLAIVRFCTFVFVVGSANFAYSILFRNGTESYKPNKERVVAFGVFVFALVSLVWFESSTLEIAGRLVADLGFYHESPDLFLVVSGMLGYLLLVVFPFHVVDKNSSFAVRSLDGALNYLAIGAFLFFASTESWQAQQLQADRAQFDADFLRLEQKLDSDGGKFIGPMCGTCSPRGVFGIRLPNATDESIDHTLRELEVLDDRWARFYSIDLSNSDVTDAGLAVLSRCPEISSLDLSNTQINGTGFSHLATLQICELYLRRLELTEADWGSLDESNLSYIDISRSRISPPFRDFRKRCSSTAIEHEKTRITRRSPPPFR